MTREGVQLSDYGSGEPESFFEIDFEADKRTQMDEEEKQRIRQELLSLEW
jgi:hypothetical protein